MTYWFDMDGTIADFYGVENWLDCLLNEDASPYLNAKPLISPRAFTNRVRKWQANGDKVGIISWTSKGGSEDFNTIVGVAKRAWLQKHFPSVVWDSICIVPYGTNKRVATQCNFGDYLFDDEERNRIEWEGYALPPHFILSF